MATLNLPEYLDYIQKYKSPSPKTIQNYRESLQYVGMNTVDMDKLPDIYSALLNRLPKGRAHITTYLKILSAWAKKNHLVVVKDINYSTLMDRLRQLIGERRAYTDHELHLLFSAAKSVGNNELLNLMLLMFYSGLRIGACSAIRYEDVQRVEGYDVYTYFVKSKGIRYQAIIAGHVWENILARTYGNKEHVVYYDPSFDTSFDKLYRAQFSRLVQRCGLYSVRVNTSIFHSFRKSFAQHLMTAGADPTSFFYKSLLGHMPRDTTATKFYINPQGERVPLEMTKTLAAVYSKSDLMTIRLGVS